MKRGKQLKVTHKVRQCVKRATLGTHLEAAALGDLGQKSLQVELHILAPGPGALDQKRGQVITHLSGWSVQLLLSPLLL